MQQNGDFCPTRGSGSKLRTVLKPDDLTAVWDNRSEKLSHAQEEADKR